MSEAKQINQGYTIIESMTVGNARFVIGENLNSQLAPHVTWQANVKNDPDNFFWGHYCTTKLGAIEDFGKRISKEAELLQERSSPRKARLTERKDRGEER